MYGFLAGARNDKKVLGVIKEKYGTVQQPTHAFVKTT
jgi:hypothetical protein